jgi:ferredoxin-type protein NapF
MTIDPRRRSFLRGRLADAAARPPAALRPPWALKPDEAFTAACTRCGECVRVCPRDVLHAGDGGFPEIRFSAAGCSLCGDCAKACVPRAIDPAAVPEAFTWRVQVADTCLNRQGVECRVCGDACEARALRFLPARGGVAQLQVRADACTGCGDCVAVCPVGAITLR